MLLEKGEIERIISQHDKEPHQRMLQKKLAAEVTLMVHNQNELDNAEKASEVLFSKNFLQEINEIDENIFLDIFDGVPMSEISLNEFKNGIEIIKILHENSGFLSSNSEARRALVENSISINKNKVDQNYIVSEKEAVRSSPRKVPKV